MKFSHYMGFRQPEMALNAIAFGKIGFSAAMNLTIAVLRIGEAKTISVMNRPPAQVHVCDQAVGYISEGITPYARRVHKRYPIRLEQALGLLPSRQKNTYSLCQQNPTRRVIGLKSKISYTL